MYFSVHEERTVGQRQIEKLVFLRTVGQRQIEKLVFLIKIVKTIARKGCVVC